MISEVTRRLPRKLKPWVPLLLSCRACFAQAGRFATGLRNCRIGIQVSYWGTSASTPKLPVHAGDCRPSNKRPHNHRSGTITYVDLSFAVTHRSSDQTVDRGLHFSDNRVSQLADCFWKFGRLPLKPVAVPNAHRCRKHSVKRLRCLVAV